jgi:hypothetical protein
MFGSSGRKTLSPLADADSDAASPGEASPSVLKKGFKKVGLHPSERRGSSIPVPSRPATARSSGSLAKQEEPWEESKDVSAPHSLDPSLDAAAVKPPSNNAVELPAVGRLSDDARAGLAEDQVDNDVDDAGDVTAIYVGNRDVVADGKYVEVFMGIHIWKQLIERQEPEPHCASGRRCGHLNEPHCRLGP